VPDRNKKLNGAAFRHALTQQAKRLGFADIAIAPARLDAATGVHLQQWLDDGCHGDMAWMESRADERMQPQTLWSDVRSVIMLGMSYAPPHNPLNDLAHRDKGLISVYAQGGDYHKWVKKALKALARWIVENEGEYGEGENDGERDNIHRAVGPQGRLAAGRLGRPSEAFAQQTGREREETTTSTASRGYSPPPTPSAEGAGAKKPSPQIKVFVDTAPVMEKPLAQLAGLGWQGKHSNLVSQSHGSWLFLGAIYTDMELPADAPGADHCGSCTACQDICPTNAFTAPYRLDARKCISYLTIEHDGPIAHQYRTAMGNRVYGCDDCLAVCPWNKFAAETQRNRAFLPRAEFVLPDLDSLLSLDKADFAAVFAGSAIKRIGRERMVRNAAIAAGNSPAQRLVPALCNLCKDDSAMVRGAAIWALWQLNAEAAEAQKARLFDQEQDEAVRLEWQQICPISAAI
jgi:epoxyqueuosine reductase